MRKNNDDFMQGLGWLALFVIIFILLFKAGAAIVKFLASRPAPAAPPPVQQVCQCKPAIPLRHWGSP